MKEKRPSKKKLKSMMYVFCKLCDCAWLSLPPKEDIMTPHWQPITKCPVCPGSCE